MGSAASNKTSPHLEKQIIKYTNGNRYEGEIKTGLRHGYGVYHYHNGDRYEGWWENNIKKGVGTFFYKDGSLYVGQWENNEKNGLGRFYYRSGDKYYGNFVKGKRNGKGCYISHDNSKYIGYFKSNMKHGKGIMYFVKGKIAKEQWKEGILISSTFINEDDDEYNDFITNESSNIDNIAYTNKVDNIEDNIRYTKKHLASASNNNAANNANKMMTLKVAKYYKARIPNNYFDAMQLVLLTSDLIYDNYNIIDWNESNIITWLNRIGIEEGKYDDIVTDNAINGIKFLKLSFNELKEYKIDDVRDVKLILKSIDFLRIFVRFQLSFSEKIEKQKSDVNTLYSISSNNMNLTTSNLILNSTGKKREILRKSYSNNALPLFHNSLIADKERDKSSEKEEIVENVENVITKMAITKLLLHSLNLSGFNFYIPFDEIKIFKKIGEGGFGQVFLGLWNQKTVAIKKFTPKEKINIKNILNKFIREINIISNLRHPNIVLYIGASLNGNNYYMVTEHIPNGNLFEFLHNSNDNISKRIDDKLQIQIAYEIAIAMKYLHSRNITHCDMKSSNILLDENYHVKISDFGLSRMVNILNINEIKGKFGTTHWMPPEIMKAKKYEEASDVFSYGMILWEMMTGKVPYYGMAPNQIIGLVADCRKIVEVPKENTHPLGKLIRNCLMYFPEKRPTFEEIIKYLDKVNSFYKEHDFITEEIIDYIN